MVLFDAGWTCLGPGARALGLLAALRGDWDAAVARLERAAELARAAGARPWLAQAQHDLARVLIARGADSDSERAQELAAAALAGAVELGLDGLAERVRAVRRAERAPTMSSVEAIAMTIEADTPARLDPAQAVPVTLLFSDIEGSTELNERLGDDRWLAVLEDHNAIVRRALAAHRGREVKSQGDGFMLAFQDPADGLDCAVAMQRSFARRNADRPEAEIRVRMGLHAGPAIRRGDDFFGRNVVVAARIAAHAQGGEILVSDAVGAGGEPMELALKGLKGTQRVHRVPWSETSANEVRPSAVTEGAGVEGDDL
jgi:class 3 adenylate cyclase